MKKILDKMPKYALPMIALLVGLLILLLPTGSGSEEREQGLSEELRIARTLEASSGVGRARVLLSEKGAVIVCDGAESPETRLNVINAVKAYTGLGSEKIQVLKLYISGGNNEKG